MSEVFPLSLASRLGEARPGPNMMLYGVRRFRFDRRNPVQSYMELF